MRCIVWTSCLLCWLSGDWRRLRALLPQPASPAPAQRALSELVSSVLPEACLLCALREGVSSDGSVTLGQDRGEHWPSSAQNSQRAPSELCLLPQTAFLGALPPTISTVPGSPFPMKLTIFSFQGFQGRGLQRMFTPAQRQNVWVGEKSHCLLWHPLGDYGMAHGCWPQSPYLLTCSQQPLMGARAAWLVRVLLYVYTHMVYVCVGMGSSIHPCT